MNTPGGYKEIEHTADWELEIWAPDLAGLLEQAARGMYALTGAVFEPGPRSKRSLRLEAQDSESLLVGFLTELLYLAETEGLGFDAFQLQLQGYRLKAGLEGAPLRTVSKEIKAVTYHNLKVEDGPQGLQARVVFDV
jgi:SHS2 domain-containing protein